jgi:hypothetical protein
LCKSCDMVAKYTICVYMWPMILYIHGKDNVRPHLFMQSLLETQRVEDDCVSFPKNVKRISIKFSMGDTGIIRVVSHRRRRGGRIPLCRICNRSQ